MLEENIKNSEIVKRLKRFVDEHSSQRAAAKALGNKNFQSSISNALAGKRMPSEELRKALDYYETQRRMEQQGFSGAPPDLQNTVVFSVTMRLVRDTRNTFYYEAIHDDAALKSAYIQKSAIRSDPPDVIEVGVKSA